MAETAADGRTLFDGGRQHAISIVIRTRQAALGVLADYRTLVSGAREHRTFQVRAVTGLAARSLVAIWR